MTTLREQGVFDLTPDRVIADDDLALIEERRQYLRAAHKDQRRAASSDVMTPFAANNTLGGVLWLRELGFAKISILSRGTPLLDFWSALKRERDIPVDVLAWEVGEAEFARSSLDWESHSVQVRTSVRARPTNTLVE